ncbi:MAG: hypothetical protein MZW92_53365 [Comamonadaceae bacterium]|nr:hypothetical protein [Comamonadaceae bacterium]
MHANGGREEHNNFLLDGVDNNDPYVNRYVVQPPVDSIQEFKIATNSYSAEYGRSAAGQVNVITRSGTQPTSSLFGLRVFPQPGPERAQLLRRRARSRRSNRNQFGLSVGRAARAEPDVRVRHVDFLREQRAVTQPAGHGARR